MPIDDLNKRVRLLHVERLIQRLTLFVISNSSRSQSMARQLTLPSWSLSWHPPTVFFGTKQSVHILPDFHYRARALTQNARID